MPSLVNAMKVTAMKPLNLIVSLIIILASALLCHQIILNSTSNQTNKIDYAELNHVKYGLFSVDEWKRQVTEILTEEINNLNLSKGDARELKKKIEVLLNILISEVDKKIKEQNKASLKGAIKQTFIDMFVSMEDIKKGIPDYADAIIHEMTKSKTKGQLKSRLNQQIKQYLDQTFAEQDTSRLSSILLRTGSKDIESARIMLDKAISVKQSLIVKESVLLIVLSVILFGLTGFCEKPLATPRYMLLVLSLIILLTAGVTTPMIDMDARISRMSIALMGHPIYFENQVLYFQSKSILDVFWIMIKHNDYQMKIVGVLVITFSIFFPLLKIISSLGYYCNYHNARENPVIKFFVFKSGKWSMADVMVVAIFMAYIGFNGIITSQFGQLKTAAQEMVILTTNGTSLQPGYFVFIAFTLLALLLSEFLTGKNQVSERQERGSIES
jgi:hypothetical protein